MGTIGYSILVFFCLRRGHTMNDCPEAVATSRLVLAGVSAYEHVNMLPLY